MHHAFIVLAALAVVALFVYSLIWAYADAEARGKPGWLVALMVLLLAWPGSLVLWMVVRPDDVGLPPRKARRL